MVFVPVIMQVISQNSGAISKVASEFTMLQQKANNARKGTDELKASTDKLNSAYEKTRTADLASRTKFELTQQKNANDLFILDSKRKQSESQVALNKDILAEKLRQASLSGTASAFQNVQKAQISLASSQAKATAAQNSYNLRYRESLDFNLKGMTNLKGEVQGLAPLMGSLEDVSKGALGSSGILGGLNSSTLAAGALTAAVGVGLIGAFIAVQKVASAFFDQISKQFSEAGQEQLAGFGSSREFQKVYNLNQDQADKAYRDLRERTEIAGRDTSVSTADIQALTSIGATPIAKVLGGRGETAEQANETIIDISKRYAVLAQTTKGVTPFQVQSAFTSAVSGDLYNASTRQEVFRNSGLKANLEQAAKELGINFKKATREQQIDILKRGLQIRVDDTLLARTQSESIQAQISRVYDSLFGLTKGIFGIERDLDSNTDGVQSVFSEFNNTIKLTIGQGGLFDEIGKSLSEAFPGNDPMVALRDGFTYLNNGIKSTTEMLREINADLVEFKNSDLGKIIKSFIQTLNAVGGVIGNEVKVDIAGIESKKQVVQDRFTGKSYEAQTVTGVRLPEIPGVFGFLNQFINSQQEKTGGLKAKPSADGFMPIANAIQSEINRKPSNSKLLIANTSEAVLTPRQLAAIDSPTSVNTSVSQPVKVVSPVVNRTENRPVTKSVTIGSLNFPTVQTNDPRELARIVIAEINAEFNRESEAELA